MTDNLIMTTNVTGTPVSMATMAVLTVAATTTAIVLSTLSTDNSISRNLYTYTKTSKQLWMKRIVSYQYYWNQTIVEQIRMYFNSSHMSNNNNSNSNGTVQSTTVTTNTTNVTTTTGNGSFLPVRDNNNQTTELLITTEEVEEFVRRIVLHDTTTTTTNSTTMKQQQHYHQQLRVAHIGRDSECMIIPPASNSSNSTPSISTNMLDHYFIWFHYYDIINKEEEDGIVTGQTTRATINQQQRVLQCVQIPLLLFNTVYTKYTSSSVSSSRIRTCTFCFIYDATLQSTLCQQIILPLISYMTKLVSSVSNNSSSTLSSSAANSTDKDDVNDILPINYFPNPSWMIQLSILLLSAQQQEATAAVGGETTTTTTTSSSSSSLYVQQLTQCFDTICTIESYSLCQSMTSINATNNNTMIYTIPTSIIPIVLPILHDLYPDDRHVFMYSGCIQSLQLVQQQEQVQQVDAKSLTNWNQPYTFHSSNTSSNSNTIYTTPIYLNNSCTVPYSSTTYDMLYGPSKRIHSLDEYYTGMGQLSLQYASQIECWMAAIHTLFERQHIQKLNFLPYICKVDYILPSLIQTLLMDDDTLRTQLKLTGSTTSSTKLNQNNIRWSVRSLYQFITGSKSRELSSEILDAACSFVLEQESSLLSSLYNNNNNNNNNNSRKGNRSTKTMTHMLRSSYYNKINTISSSVTIQKVIENIVFQHKLILLPNKTLLDTVQPTEYWTLKQPTKKGGCACCSPEDEEDDEDGGDDMTKNKTMSIVAMNNEDVISSNAIISMTKVKNKNPFSGGGFVDGSTTFAFDPSKFVT